MRCHGPIRGPILGALLGLAVAAPAHAAACLRNTEWEPQVAPWDQKMSLEPLWRRGNRSLVAIRFEPLKGAYAKRFGFFLYNGRCVIKAMTVGAFAAANGGREVNRLPKGATVLYHQDYYAGRRHVTMLVSQEPPDFSTVRAQALDLLR